MAKYDELVEKLRFLAKVYSICENESTNEYRLAVEAANAIEELAKDINVPSKDCVEVVRCADCKHNSSSGKKKLFYQWCNERREYHEFDWYCADGERKGTEVDFL